MSDYHITPKCALMLHSSDEKPLSMVSLLKEDNRLSFLLEDWKEFYASLPYLLDDASTYICNGPWREDDEPDENYDFIWSNDGPKDERDLHDALLTTSEVWTDVSLQLKRFVVKPLLIRMPNFEVRLMIAVRKYRLDEEERIKPLAPRYGLNLTLREVIMLINNREKIHCFMDAHERAFSVKPEFPPDLPPVFMYYRHLFGSQCI